MLDINAEVFLQRPEDAASRALHACRVTDAEDEITVRFEGEAFEAECGGSCLVFYRTARDFLKAPVTIVAVDTDDEGTSVRFAVTGTAVSADARQFYRVVTIASGLEVEVDSKQSYTLTDISQQGFSFIANHPYAIGDTITATLAYDGTSFTGTGRVQSIKELDGTRVRVGVLCIDDRKGASTLPRGLQLMTMQLQREQLKRRAG